MPSSLVLNVSAPIVVPSSEHVFSITEVKLAGDGTFNETGVKFVWDARSQSSPRDSWDYGIKQRTAREDYPGADQPTEQVLGPNYEPFELHGCWDDRYAGTGFAEATRVAMEALVQRGNFCRLTLDNLSITGLITDLKISYKRQFYIHYTFTFSPHFRNSGGDVRRQVQLAPKVTATPTDYAFAVRSIVEAMQEEQDNAPKEYVAGTTYTDVGLLVDDIIDKSNVVDSIVDTRIFAIDDVTVNAMSRVVSSFVSMQVAATNILDSFAATQTDTTLFYEDAIPNLDFDNWTRAMSDLARQMILQAAEAAQELARLVVSDALALYRPYKGQSLYDISTQFYNTPHRWRDIADRNNLYGFVLTGTEMLVIPRAV